MTDKAPDAYRTISEVAEDIDLPQHVLRFWETRFSQIKPLKRAGGRRYYRPDDVALLRGIRELLYGRGFTIKGVQKILREQGGRAVQDIGLGKVNPALFAASAAEAADASESDVDEAAAVAKVAEPVPAPAPVPSPPRRDLADLKRRLDAVGAELGECRRLIAGARAA
jgi:DNA-binding transcriptional MerR regulator